jgi:hypothetical protein
MGAKKEKEETEHEEHEEHEEREVGSLSTSEAQTRGLVRPKQRDTRARRQVYCTVRQCHF